MPVVPEKRQLEDHVHAALGAQFWSQGVENSRYLSGQACTSPCEPQPLRLTAPSGLSRAQFLVATRAVRLPIFPGYCDDHGGTVLDRVLLQSGSHKWWAALIGRGKMQRAWNQHTAMTIRENLSDPHNYALAATGRLQLSDSTVLRATLQSDSLTALQPLLPQQKWNWQQSWNWGSSNALHRHHHQQQQQQQQQHAGQPAAAVPEPPRRPRQQQQQQSRLVRLVQGNSLKLQLKQQLECLDLSADLALNEMCVDGVTRYAATPLRLAVDIAPSSSSTKRLKLRQGPAGSSGIGVGGGSSSGSSDAAAAGSSGGSGWLQGVLFRVGVHGVVAPRGDVAAAAAGGSGSGATRAAAGSSNSQQQQREHRVSLHAQGALALTGSATLWQAADKPWQSAAAERRSHHKQQQQQQQRSQQAELEVQPLQVTDNSSSSSKNTSATAQQGVSTAASKGDVSSSSKDSSSTKPQKGSSSSKGRHSSSRGVGGKQRVLTFQGQEFKLPLLNPGSVQESIQDASSSLERLRTDLRSWTTRVEAGELQNIGQKEPSAGILSRPPGSCWSSFIPGPHFKVCGLIGVLGRVPLHQQDILLPTSASNSSSSQRQHQHHSRSSSAASLPPAAAAAAAADGDAAAGGSSSGMRPEGGRPLGDRARGVLAASATHLDRLVLGSARKLGRSITQDSLLRLFGSAGASLQVGEMRSNFFDFTRVEAVLDLGLNGPESLVQAPAAAAAAAGAAGQSSSGAGASRNRTRAGAAPSKAAGSRGSGGTVRSASPARGMATILGPAAAAAHAAAAAQPPLPPSAAGVVVGSSDGSPRSSTIGSNASGVGGHPRPTAGSSAPAAAPAALPPTGAGAGAAAAAGGGSGVVGNSSSVSGTGRHKHPAFALDERGVWHSLTLSATQQLFGPVRLRADARLALDSVHPCPRGAGLLQPSAALQVLNHVVGVRPALVDAAYGVDMVVPGASGLVRLVGWYSPGRGEGGLGLRLM